MRTVHLLAAAVCIAVLAAGCAADEIGTPSASPTPGPQERFQTPRSLDSYRYTLDLTVDGEILDQSEAPAGLDMSEQDLTIEIEGMWMNPDAEYSATVFTFGVLEATQETIRIGERVWSRESGGAWREREPLTEPGALVGQNVPLSPNTIFSRDDGEVLERVTADLEARPFTREVVLDRETRHWQLDQDWFDQFAPEWDGVLGGVPRDQGMELAIDIWADVETGVGIQLEVEGRHPDHAGGLHLLMQLFDLNDPTISVAPPVGAIGR